MSKRGGYMNVVMRRGDRVRIGDVTIDLKKAGELKATVCVSAPSHTPIIIERGITSPFQGDQTRDKD